jgi:hypothetical protein
VPDPADKANGVGTLVIPIKGTIDPPLLPPPLLLVTAGTEMSLLMIVQISLSPAERAIVPLALQLPLKLWV